MRFRYLDCPGMLPVDLASLFDIKHQIYRREFNVSSVYM